MKKLLLTLITFAFVHHLQAQIVYKDIMPDTTILSGQYELRMNASANGSVIIDFDTQAPGRITATTSGDYEIRKDNLNLYPESLEHGKVIDNSGNWMAMSADTISYGGHIGRWLSVHDNYLPVRFKLSGVWHYGWLKMDVDMVPTMFVVKEWAYNTNGDERIKSGQIFPANVPSIKEGKSINIYANDRTVYIDGMDIDQKNRFIIYDILGKEVCTETVHSSQFKKSFNYLPDGVYIVILENKKGRYVKRVVL